jgi:hypothetical protein
VINLMETILGGFNADTVTKIGETVGADPLSTGKAMTAAVPAMVSGLATQAARPGGASALLGLLNQGQFGNIVGNLSGYLSNPVAAGGVNLVQQIFGGDQSVAESQVAKASGLSAGAIGRLLPLLAPIVMGALGNVAKTQSLDAAGLGKFLSDQQGLIRSSAPGLLGFLERIDANDDGSIMDDLGRLAGRLFGRG